MFASASQRPTGDIQLKDPLQTPNDSVSCISWAPKSEVSRFACSAWDSSIRTYEVVSTGTADFIEQKSKVDVEDPCVSVAWSNDMCKLYAGCINNSIKSIDIATGLSTEVGKHDAGVKDVYWVQAANILCSLSYDKTMRFWDLRQQNAVAKFDLGLKIFCSDMFFPHIAIGMESEKVLIVTLPTIQKMFTRGSLPYIDSPLGKGAQLTSVGFFTDGTGMAVGSHDGRANISRLETDHTGMPKLGHIMTFKSNFIDQPGGIRVTYPTHGIGFHPKSKDFIYTAGGEGSVIFWDFKVKEKIKTCDYRPNPVVQAKMSPDGKYLAYALGYDWAKGVREDMSFHNNIALHVMQDNELRYIR